VDRAESHDTSKLFGGRNEIPVLGLAEQWPAVSNEADRSTLSFAGRLSIPGLPYYPRQKWTVTFTPRRAVFENQPENSWPKVRVEFVSDEPFAGLNLDVFLAEFQHLKVSRINIRPLGDNALGEVFYTRLVLSVNAALRTSLTTDGEFTLFGLRHEPISPSYKDHLDFRLLCTARSYT